MSDTPIRSKSSLYFERYAKAEEQNMTLKLTLYFSGALCVFLAASLVFVATRPKPIHYVAATAMDGISYPGEVPSTLALSFATAWLMNWVNYSPVTARDVYERSFNMMAPSFLARIKAGVGDELAKISREKISSVFTLKEEPRLEEGRAGSRTIFSGERAVYIGKEEMLREDVVFSIDLRRAPVTRSNPYGLVVWDVAQQKVLHEKS